jgi:hypothetical protein
VFVALLDYTREGNHKIICPYCSHIHWRVIKAGRITEDRWSSAYGKIDDEEKISIKPRRIWKSSNGRTMVMPEGTNAASQFLRQRWLERL